jgi:site-specific recombinase XerD
MARPFAKVRGVFERPKGSGIWWIRYADQYGRIHREKIGPRGLAIEAYRKRKAQIKEGNYFPEKMQRRHMLFEDMASMYLEDHSRVNKRSYRDDCQRMRRFTDEFSNKALREITIQDVERLKAKLARGVAPATVNRYLGVLKNLFTKAIEWGKTETNPVKAVKLFKENNQRIRFLSHDEEEALIRETPEEYRPLIKVALHTGLRRGEQFALNWNNVDFNTGIITITQTKSGEARRVPMNGLVAATLRKLPSRMRNEYVFTSKVGTPLNPQNFINRVFGPALRKAGIKDFRWHDLRHTFASRLVMDGVDLRTVQELLGHKTIAMTLRYSHLSPGHLQAGVEGLCKGINRGQTGTATGTSSAMPPASDAQYVH